MKYLKLFETYNSNKELTKLCKEIISLMCKNYKNGDEEYPIIELSDIDYNNYTEIKEFIKNNPKLQIFIDTKYLIHYIGVNSSDKGAYLVFPPPYNIKVVCLKELHNTRETINKYNDLYSDSYYMSKMYIYTLLHEFVHAYDDYRSNGKYSDTTSSTKVIDNNYLDYSNSKHEVDARFNQAVQKTDFQEIDDIDEEGYIYKLLPFDICFKSFKRNFVNYHVLPNREKKRIDSMFAKYYIKFKSEFSGRDEN